MSGANSGKRLSRVSQSLFSERFRTCDVQRPTGSEVDTGFINANEGDA